MRQRITLLQEPNDAVDPKSLKITQDSIERKGIRAAREERLTFAFEELPQELYRVLKASYEVHVRWVSDGAYAGMGPLLSRLSPGLHVLYTPQGGNSNSDLLCPILKKSFGDIDCISPTESFTSLPIDRFSHSSALQYYTQLPSLSSFTTYLEHRLCTQARHSSCYSRISALKTASYVDIDYDTISHALILTSFHPSTIQHLNYSIPIPSSRLELGLLTVEAPIETEELSLGGFLTVLGDPDTPSPKPKATLFSFPSRHHSTPQTFSSKFLSPTGLHPSLQISISDPAPPLEDRTCSLHTHLTLPKQIFLDRHQFTDPLFLASKNLTALRYITSPVDPEAPSYALSSWGSSILLELSPPLTKDETQNWTSEIPLHLRYLPPNSNHSGTADLEIPYPVLFWACTADEGSKFPINPFDRTNLGYDGLFGPRTLFYHLTPNPGPEENAGRLVNMLSVPVLDLDGSRWVEIGTGAVVLLGFSWVLWCLLGVWRGSGYGSGEEDAKGKEKKTN